jgi:hypothetical protein
LMECSICEEETSMSTSRTHMLTNNNPAKINKSKTSIFLQDHGILDSSAMILFISR